MAGNILKPFISYNDDFVYLYPGFAREEYRERIDRDAKTSVAADGSALTYLVGQSRFIELIFQLQPYATVKADWINWWNAVKDGKEFRYHDDDSCRKASASYVCSSSIICGELLTTGAVDRNLRVKLDIDSFQPEEDIVHGLYNVPVRMRVIEVSGISGF
jgi:hypothetical protein